MKNVRPLAGKPLIQWTIEAALGSKYISDTVVSTDSPEIADIARAAGAMVPFLRPANLATDSSTTIDVVLHALEWSRDFDYIVLLQPTSPLRIASDIDSAIELMAAKSSESCVSICPPSKHPHLMYTIGQTGRLLKLMKSGRSEQRQNLPPIFSLNGAIYISSIDHILASKSFISEDTVGFEMPETRSIDIDTELDFAIAELVASA